MTKILKKPKIGLALGSGAIRGLAHVGVIKALLKHQIPIDYLSGSSIGAWVGAHYGLFQDIRLLEKLMIGNKKEKLFSFLEPSFEGGIIKGEKVEKLLKDWLTDASFKDLKIPLWVAATDLASGQEVVLKSGKLAPAVRISMSIPGLFKPVLEKNKILVDGGACNPVPDNLAKKMGADIVIAVNLDHFTAEKASRINLDFTTIAERTMLVVRHHLAQKNMRDADIIIQPPLNKYASWKEYFVKDVGDSIIRVGERAAERAMPLIQKKIRDFNK